MNQVKSLTLDNKQIKRLKDYFNNNGLPNTNPYITFFIQQDGYTISLYTSNKCVFQGEGIDNLINNIFGDSFTDENDNKANDNIFPQAGSDEVGTGDVFGPVVVVACYVTQQDYDVLKKYNITDSKAITDAYICEIAPVIMQQCSYSCLVLDNEKYNKVHNSNNLNQIKAKLHNKAYLNLKQKINDMPNLCVIDQFAAKDLYFSYLKNEQEVYSDLTFYTKAESKYFAVACASIIARYQFLKVFDQLSDFLQIELHKGANSLVDKDIDTIIEKYGKAMLYKVAKCHFKNIKDKM